MCEALRELMADEIHESVVLGEQREKAKGLKALVDILKGMHLDLDSAYQSISKTEAYADISKEQLMKYWQ